MKRFEEKLDKNTGLEVLSQNRDIYQKAQWLDANKCSIYLWEMEDDFILHCMKIVSSFLGASVQFPLVEDLKSFNGFSYKDWAFFLYNEFLFREAALQKQYEDYCDQSSLDSYYYYY